MKRNIYQKEQQFVSVAKYRCMLAWAFCTTLLLLFSLSSHAQTRLYWVQSSGTPADDRLSSANLDGSNRVDLAVGNSASTFNNPLAVAVDTDNGIIYVGDVANGTGISSFRLSDGSYIGNVIPGSAASINAIQVVGSRIYWVQSSATATDDRLSSANLDGSNRTDLAAGNSTTTFINPQSLYVDVATSTIYVGDGAGTGSTGISRFPIGGGAGTNVIAASAAFNGIQVVGSRIYWVQSSATATDDRLSSANLDGTNRTDLAAGNSTTTFINPQSLYVDVATSTIYVGDGAGTGSTGISRFPIGGGAGTNVIAASAAFNSITSNRTQAVAPTLTTATPVSVATTTAQLGGNITNGGGATVTERGVVYSTSNTTPTVGGSGTTTAPNGSGTSTFSATISSLTPGTRYYVQAYATNSAGTSYGGVQQFVTAPNAPSVVTPANGGFVSTTNPIYTGTAQGNATITVYVDNTSIGTTTANASGNWVLTQSTALGQGSHTVYATAAINSSAASANSNTNTFTVDTTRPSVTISSTAGGNNSTTGTSPIPFTITFSESVTGFSASDVTVGNGTVSGFSGSGTTYTVNVTPTTAGVATTVNIAANAAQDAAGNGNTAASPFSITYQQPAVTVASVTRLTPSPTATDRVSYRVVFSGSVSGLTLSNFSLTTTGLIGASFASVSGSGTTYTATVNTGSGDGTLRLNIANATGLSPTISNIPYTSGEPYTITRSFAAAPTLRIQAAGSATGNGDVTAFVDLVQVLQSGTSTAVAGAVQNGSFETNNVQSGNYLYQSQGVVAAPWSFGPQSGVARNNSAFGSTAANGDAVAFLQSVGGSNGNVSQNLALPTGSYQVRFLALQRNYTSLDQRLNVFVNDVYIGTIQSNNIPTYDIFTSASFNVTAPALTATVNTPSASPTSNSPIPFSVSFSQSVGSSFTASDVTVSGGTLTGGSFSGSGSGPYTFTVTPTGIGTVTVSLAANVAQDANNTGNTASNSVSVQFQSPTITLAPASLPNGQQGTAYSQALVTSGGTAPYAYAITNGALPTGLTLSSSGTISGTPTANGTYNFTVTTRDNSAAPGPYSGSRAYTLVINPQPVTAAPVVTTPANGSLTNNRQPTYVGTATANSTVTVYVGPSAGTASALGSTTADASGNFSLAQPTALADGAYRVYATAQTNGSTVSANSNTNTFTVDTTVPTVTLSSATVPNGGTTSTSPVLFTATFSEPVTGFASAGISVSGGSVTSGPTVGSGNAYTFQVTPSGVGTVAVQVLANTVQDRAGNNNTISSPYAFTFQAPTITLAPISLPNGTVGVAYSLVFTATGGTSPYTYAITAGALPTGMTLAGNGTLSGTPTAGGSFNFTVTATDNATSPGPYSGSRSYTFTINAPTVALLPNTLPDGQQGTAYSVVFTALGGTSPYTYAIAGGALPAGLTLASNGTLSGTPTGSGSFNFTVTATDASTGSGPYRGLRSYTLVINPQPVTTAPVVTAPANGALINTTTPTYTGTAPANSTVTVYIDETSIGITTANASGNWSLTQPTALSQGNHQVRATAQRSGQAVSGSSNTNTFTVDTVAPAVVITSTAGTSGGATGTTPIPFTVTFSENVTGFIATDLTVSGGSVANFAGSGTTYTVEVTPAADGLVTINVPASVAQDGANNGNTAASPFSITYTRPVTAVPFVATPADGSVITATRPTYTGTATALANVTVVIDGNTSGGISTVANGSGNWTLPQPTDLAVGAHTVQARAQLTGQTASAYSAVNSFTVVGLATVTTATPTGVTNSGATLGGEVTDAGSGTVSERGVVYVMGNGTPTTNDTKISIGTGTGSFAQAVTNLTPSASYSVRAYAINQAGTSYGITQTFSTANALTIGSVTPSPVCAGATITVAYTNSLPGTPLQLFLNGPSTTNLLLASLASSQGSGTITAAIPADRVAGQYSVYLSGGGTTSGSVALTVNAVPPAPAVVSPVTYCQNAVASPLSATGITGASLRWYSSAVGSTGSTTAPTPPTSVAAAINYYVSQILNGCESARATLTVIVTPLPQAPSTTPVTVCQNTTPVSLATGVTASPGASLNWYTNATGGVASSVAPAPPTSTVGATNYYVSQTVNGCESPRAALTYTVNALPVADLTNDGPLTCAKTTVTLTAAGGSGTTYQFSPGASQIGSSNQATVSSGGPYSVTVTNGNGCSATAQTTVDVNTSVAAPTLTASALSTENTPISVTASGCNGTINWTATGGTGTINGSVYTFNQVGNYTLTATCTVGTCTSPAAPLLTLQIRPGGFAISGVDLVRCQLVDAGRGQYEISLNPQYSGLTGSPVSFGITNELAATTAPGPYSLRLYTDNATITLAATQANAQATYRYNWLAACNSTQPAPNRPPVAQPIPNQVLVVGQPYQLELTTYFADPDGQPLTFTATGLPAGLQLSGSRISGSPAQAGTSTVQVTALDPAGAQVVGSVVLQVNPAPTNPTPGVFSIAGVTGVRCETLSAGERQLSFSPVYTGLTGAPVSFGITNELATTTAPGPYSLRLYTDNPTITLVASQGGTSASYRYDWLASCATNPTTPPAANRPPVVSTGLANQTAQVGQGYTLFIAAGTFTDPDNDPLQISVSGLPAGLSFSAAQNAITGTPVQAGSSTIQVTATDPGGLSVSTSFVLTVQPASTTPTPGVFSIAGVTGVRCETLSAGERQLSFSPVYTGLTGAPVSFGITNELATTTAPGPYSLRLYTDNPTITLVATQGGSSVSYRYDWLAGCATSPNGRQAVAEAGSRLSVVVLGNPVVGESVDVIVRGVAGQAVELSVTDLAGNRLYQQSIPQAATDERVRVPVSTRQAITMLTVRTATQHQTIKLIRQ